MNVATLLHLRRTDQHAEPFPWEGGHAAPEDVATGLELELIELVHRRSLALRYGDPTDELDREIERTTLELDQVSVSAAVLAAPTAVPHAA